MTTDDDLICTHDPECPEPPHDSARLFREAAGYLLVGGLILGGLTVLAWFARAWMLEPATRGWR